MPASLSIDDIVARLDDLLEVEFSFRNTVPAAESIAELPRDAQEFALALVGRVASTNVEIGYRVAIHAGRALAAMDERMVEAWGLNATHIYDRVGLRPALQAVEEVEQFVHRDRMRRHGALLEDAAGVLSHFLHGLSGRALKVAEGDAAWTDTETIHLPAALAELPESRDNFQLYKVTAAFLWAQTRFGTFRVPLHETLAGHPQPGRLLGLFLSAERLRLEACLARELPGLHREMCRLAAVAAEPELPPAWSGIADALRAPQADAFASLAAVMDNIERLEPLVNCYQGELRPEAVAHCMAARAEKEKALFRLKLKDLADEQRERTADSGRPESEGRFEAHRPPEERESLELEITLDDKPVPPPEGMRRLARSILLDFGDIPPDYLVPAGPGEYDPRDFEERQRDPDAVWQGTYHEDGASHCDEWDYRRQHYRKAWCVVREVEVTPAEPEFRANTLRKYTGLVRHLRKTFEAMRDEDRTLSRQSEGDDLDIDALVEALADAHGGAEMSDRLYTRLHRSERNIAVVFMVDMSGSTRGWINDAERESLILLSEALETLGDRFAIYGFSGLTRKRCEIFRVKGFDEPYGEEVQGRIAGIRPRDYTRMGFAIRHLAGILAATEARTRILITLSDGKPDDYSDYRGEYGIEDTRQALIEAKRLGIHPFCITIDEEGPNYLPRMYGPVNYTVVADVRKLPCRVGDIYRRLTT